MGCPWDGRPTTLFSPGGGRIECCPVSAGGKKGHAGRTSWEHYGSPGRLADYRRQFEKTTRQEGEDPLIFAIALETLAVKAFGDMGPNARLWLIRDRFVAGLENCALRRHLDSVPPETPMRDIVDRCRLWESHADTGARRIVKPSPERALPVYTVDELACVLADRVVAAVSAPPVGPGDLEALLRCLLPTVPVQTVAPTNTHGDGDLADMPTVWSAGTDADIAAPDQDNGN